MFRSEIWLISNLFAFGVIAGMGYVMVYPPGAAAPSTAGPGDPPSTALVFAAADQLQETSRSGDDEIDSREIVELVKQGDRSLLTGNIQAATVRYRKAAKLCRRPSIPLTVRLAVCAEKNGNLLLAERLYAEVEKSAVSQTQLLIATLGSARVWHQLDKTDDALRSMADLLIHSQDLSALPMELQAQGLYELANLVQAKALVNYHFDPTQPDGLIFHSVPPDLTMLLELLDAQLDDPHSDPQPGELSEANPVAITLVQRPVDSVISTIVSARKGFTPLKELLAEIATVGKFEPRISDKAGAILSARSKSLHFRSKPMSLILDGLLAPLGLYWVQANDQLKIQALDEIADPEQRTAISLAVADRMFRQFSLSFPGDYRFQSAMLASGNLNLLNQDLESAGNQYETVAASHPVGELQAALAFNQGQLSTRLGRRSVAIDQLYLAVDQTYDPLIKSCGYCLIGQLFIEQDDLDNAIYAASRGLATARDSKRKQLAALTLSRSYLLSNNPMAANKVLFDNRHEFDQSPLAPTVTLLSNYAQYIGVEDQHGRTAAEDRLIYSLSGMTKDPLPSCLDLYVAGRAYQELGFPEKAIERFSEAAAATNIQVWKNRILFALAVEKGKTGQEKDAAEIFDLLIETEAPELARLARIQLAELYLRNDMPTECLGICKQLMSMQLEQAEKAKLFSMMGFAFRSLDQHHSSALCFAGIFPADMIQ